ncbi:MAG: hypothetical protein ACYC0Q_06015 [Eubacteriales bacterium]
MDDDLFFIVVKGLPVDYFEVDGIVFVNFEYLKNFNKGEKGAVINA